MKVCTDACLFGAWVANLIKEKNIPAELVLDIGTGTGLLSLMLSQETGAMVDAIEIDKDAFLQATANIAASPFAAKIYTWNVAVQKYSLELNRYPFIICNPPFFKNDLKSTNIARNTAMHSDQLTLTELINQVKRLLTENGKLAVLLPFQRSVEFVELCKENRFYIEEYCNVKQTDQHSFFRTMFLIGTKEVVPIHSELSIKYGSEYSELFRKLLKPYYLQF